MIFLFPAFAEAANINVPKSAVQGGVIRILITDPNDGEYQIQFSPVGWPQNDKIIVVRAVNLDGGRKIALIPVAPDEVAGLALITIFTPTSGNTYPVEIKKTNFPESLRLFHIPKPTPEILKKSQEEREFLDDIYARLTQKKYFSGNLLFASPLEKMDIVPNANFGQIRKKVLVNPKTYKTISRWKDYHKGADFLAFTGTPVFAVEDGRVVAARRLLGSGNTIIIDHGYGLLSLYFHLAKIDTQEGVEVVRGQKIGLVGMSGNAEGPHLHFEIRLYGVPVNPFGFFRPGGVK